MYNRRKIVHLIRPRLLESGAVNAGFSFSPWIWLPTCCPCLLSTKPATLLTSTCGLSKATKEIFVHRRLQFWYILFLYQFPTTEKDTAIIGTSKIIYDYKKVMSFNLICRLGNQSYMI